MGAIVTYKMQDSFGRVASARFEHRTNTPPSGDVQAMATSLANVTKLGVVSATVSYAEDVTAQATTPEAGANRQVDAFLQTRKADGGTYTFTLMHPKDALVNANGTLDLTAGALINFVENFDDGTGIAGIAGDWYISDGEELLEGTGGDNILAGGLNKD